MDKKAWALLLSTPQGANWFYKLYLRGQERDRDFASWNFPSWTNPHLKPELIEKEKNRLPRDVFRQEYGAEFLGDDVEACEVCGGARTEGVGLVVLEGDGELARCAACNGPADAEGRALGKRNPNGDSYLKILDLRGEHPPLLAPTAG